MRGDASGVACLRRRARSTLALRVECGLSGARRAKLAGRGSNDEGREHKFKGRLTSACFRLIGTRLFALRLQAARGLTAIPAISATRHAVMDNSNKEMNMASNKTLRTTLPTACLLLLGVGALAACGGEGGSFGENASSTQSALGAGGGSAQARLIGTHSIRLAARVTTVGGLATNALSLESGTVTNGDANINNTTTSQVHISGATINGNVQIAGAAPSVANGELVNGGKITGTVSAGSATQSTLASHTVTPGTTPVQVNSGGPAITKAPGNYGAVQVNGSKLTFASGTFNLASLVVNSGAQIVFDTSTGPVDINVQGTVTLNGGTASVLGSGLVTLYSNSTSSNAITVNAGVGSLPATITAPNGGIVVGSRNTRVGSVGGKDVAFDPDSHISQ